MTLSDKDLMLLLRRPHVGDELLALMVCMKAPTKDNIKEKEKSDLNCNRYCLSINFLAPSSVVILLLSHQLVDMFTLLSFSDVGPGSNFLKYFRGDLLSVNYAHFPF